MARREQTYSHLPAGINQPQLRLVDPAGVAAGGTVLAAVQARRAHAPAGVAACGALACRCSGGYRRDKPQRAAARQRRMAKGGCRWRVGKRPPRPAVDRGRGGAAASGWARQQGPRQARGRGG